VATKRFQSRRSAKPCGSSASLTSPGRRLRPKQWIGISIRISWRFWNRCSAAGRRSRGSSMIGVLRESENNVLSFLAEIAYRLIPQELTPNQKYPHNPCVCSYLQKLATFGSLFGLSTGPRAQLGHRSAHRRFAFQMRHARAAVRLLGPGILCRVRDPVAAGCRGDRRRARDNRRIGPTAPGCIQDVALPTPGRLSGSSGHPRSEC